MELFQRFFGFKRERNDIKVDMKKRRERMSYARSLDAHEGMHPADLSSIFSLHLSRPTAPVVALPNAATIDGMTLIECSHIKSLETRVVTLVMAFFRAFI